MTLRQIGPPTYEAFPGHINLGYMLQEKMEYGRNALVHRYEAEVKLGQDEAPVKIQVVIPARWYGQPNLSSKKKAEAMLEAMPRSSAQSLRELHFYPLGTGTAALGRAIPETRTINIYSMAQLRPKWVQAQIFLHELGHLIQQETWGVRGLPEAYREAIAADRRNFSLYSSFSEDEDFADAVMKYVSSDGGKRMPSLRRKYQHRFAFLDQVFETNPTRLTGIQSLIHGWTSRRGIALWVAAGGIYWKFGDDLFQDDDH